MTSPLKKHVITVAEAARIIGVHHSQVTRYIKDGLLTADRVGNQLFMYRNEVERFERPGQGFRRDLETSQKV